MRSGPHENLVPVQQLRRGPLRIDSGGAKPLLLSRVELWSFHRPRLLLRRFYHPCKPIRKHYFHLFPPFSTEYSLFRSWTTLPNPVGFSHADSNEPRADRFRRAEVADSKWNPSLGRHLMLAKQLRHPLLNTLMLKLTCLISAWFGDAHSLRRVFLAEISNTTFPSGFVVTTVHS